MDTITQGSPAIASAASAGDGALDRVQLGLLAALATTCMLALFAAQIFLALAVVVYFIRLAMRRFPPSRVAIEAPILAFVVWTLLSASFSQNPDESFRTGVKKLVLFLIVYVAFDSFLRRRARERVFDAVLLGALVLGLGMIIQYYFFGFDSLNKRPTSFLGHWMTASGLSMCALVLAAARLTLGSTARAFPTAPSRKALIAVVSAVVLLSILQRMDVLAVEGERLFIVALAVAAAAMATARGAWPDLTLSTSLAALTLVVSSWALLVSLTRSAWLGALAGLSLVLVLKKPRTLWILAACIFAIFVLRPEPVMRRLTLSDESSLDRYYMWQAGIDMLVDQPIFGQGPGMIPFAYERYRWPEAPQNRTSHLHNNALQIAAERGLPCAVFWLWWVALTLGEAFRQVRRGRAEDRWLAAGVLGAMTSILVAGLFEYNFGDSEVLYMILLLSVTPFAIRQEALEPAR